ncbi:MAG: carbon starvation CstA family protein [bacterium]
MNVSVPMIVTIPLFVVAYFVYARYVAAVLGVDPSRQPPAVALRDDRDYVPTRLGVVFSHHFASIAGGGPILGPTLAMIYGYSLTLVWIVLGCIFFGGVHDFTTLFVSVRERGKSMAEVARKSLGEFGFFLFIAFTIIMLLMVCAAFLNATVAALTSKYPLALMGVDERRTILRTVIETKTVGGVETTAVSGIIGGIASTSVIVITACAPFLGWLLYIRKIPVSAAAALAFAICAGSIFVGINHPVSISPDLWRIILCVYVLLAAGLPVWIVLQPRDFTNAFILYFGIALILVMVIFGGLTHPALPGPAPLETAARVDAFHIHSPASNFEEGAGKLGMVWPILFITVACGAISGFHSLVAGGTSSKQLCSEAHTKAIGYGGMLLEGVLAVGVLSVVAAGIEFGEYTRIVFPDREAAAAGARSNPILAFALAMGALMHGSLGLPRDYGTVFGILLVEGFVVTTLDTAVRLNRYLLEELWAILFRKPPAVLRSYVTNAGLVVALAYLLTLGSSIDRIWPIFGASNQLLAALVLIAVAVWLVNRRKPVWFVVLPALFMTVTTIASLVYLLAEKHLKTMNYPLIVSDALLIALSAGVLVMLFLRFFRGTDAAATERPAG